MNAPPRCVEVRIVRVLGSAPREVGACMLVGEDFAHGSIGGGHLEWHAQARARELLRDWRAGAQAPQRETHALGPSLGQCCGGVVTLEYAASQLGELPPAPPLFALQLHGAGHVGRALVRLLSTLPCSIDWIDERDDAFAAAPLCEAAGPASIRRIAVDAPQAEVTLAPAGGYVLVMTHSHELDARICEAALRRADLGFVGLIGSRTKRARFEHRWLARGMQPEALQRLVCPIGDPRIPGKRPEVLAMAVAAQLLQHASTRSPTLARRRSSTPA